jgi:hypothetical protein
MLLLPTRSVMVTKVSLSRPESKLVSACWREHIINFINKNDKVANMGIALTPAAAPRILIEQVDCQTNVDRAGVGAIASLRSVLCTGLRPMVRDQGRQ